MKDKKDIPRVSVVMPIYNSGRFLEEGLNSILNQSFSDFEVIIVDNGSTDNSRDIEDKYKKKDNRIRIIKLAKPNVQIALNEGFRAARGEYIARMDADDISFKDRFKIQVDYLDKHPEISLIGCSAVVIDEDGNRLGILQKHDSLKRIERKLRKSNCLIHPSIMFRNTGELFFREKFKTSEDYDLYLRMLTSNKKITNLSNFLIKYRISKKSFVSTMPNQEFYFKKAKEFYLQREKFGKDDYENLKPPIIYSEEVNFDRLNSRTKIFVKFQDNQMKDTRKEIKNYFNKYGFEKSFFIYYILSFFPPRLIRFLREIF